MTDVTVLERRFADGGLVRPDPGRTSFVDLARALASLAGVEGLTTTEGSGRLRELIGPAEHLIFILIDGLGDELLSRAPATGMLRRHRVTRLQAVFPSTTAAALTSLATASWPCEHASCGWWMYLPSRRLSITTLPFVERFGGRPLFEHNLSVRDVLPLPSVWAGAARSTRSFLKEEIKDAPFARYMSGDGSREGYSGVEDALARVARRVFGARSPTFTYLYLPQLDASCHDKGIESSIGLLEELDGLLDRFLEDLEGRARVVISADHGMIDLPDDGSFVLDEGHKLLQTLEVPPTGEPTMPIFHVRPGEESRFLGLARALLGDSFALITPDEVEGLGLFGPGELSGILRPRLGTYIGVSSGAALYYRSPGRNPFFHRAVHCGLSPGEMWIPLIVAGEG